MFFYVLLLLTKKFDIRPGHCRQINGFTSDQAESSMLDLEEFLNKFHHALLHLHLEEGALICPETGRQFPVTRRISYMLLHEDDV